ncbi:MAG: glucose-6-phosphate isomerase [Gammaproteobacteria bacterium]|nr:glucose-6-phosphate isomerase [Gammaproteobacteria bacterium]
MAERSKAWKALERHAEERCGGSLRDLFDRDPHRFERFSLKQEGLLFDYSRHPVTDETMRLLLALGGEMGLADRIEGLFSGESANNTECRPALHVALRNRSGRPMPAGSKNVMPQVEAELAKMRELVDAVHAGSFTGSTGRRITDVVNIGIGGSDLGAVMAVEALARFRKSDIRTHFVSNVDGVQISDVLGIVHAETTLFIVCSKSFTTLETMINARQARDWLITQRSEAAVTRHFVAVSVNAGAMDEFGIASDLRFAIWDWVGGRYSLWSAVGLAIAFAVGMDHFERLLAGAHAMDEHFRRAPFERNLPVIAALLGVWNVNFQDAGSLVILPYDQRLHRFPAYLQQLEMESNGKRVTRDGEPVEWQTCPIVWGEPGSNAQHSFYQLLHQGTRRFAADFIVPVNASSDFQQQQDLALANCLAQAEALMGGQTEADVVTHLERQALDAGDIARLAPHKVHPGDRPSSIYMFPQLDSETLGKLIALYEHKVFVQSVIWNINAFDQWGVELGKKLAARVAPAITGESAREALSSQLRSLLKIADGWRDQ